MIIQKQRINNVAKYMKRLGDIDQFYICVKNSFKNRDVLIEKNVCMKVENGIKVIPRPIGPVTRYNADGKKVVRKDLDKEPRTIEHDFHIIDWHGQDHYGTCYQTRMCFPIQTVLPPCEEITIDETIIRSEILRKKDYDRIKHVINMFLEIFGVCEVVDANLQSISTTTIKHIPWKILPPGKYPWEKAKEYLKNYFNSVPESKIKTIQKRHKFLAKYEPDFVAVGEESFNGYVVYGYTERNVYYFESNEPNNATYVFIGEWEEASKLTKRDIIMGKLCYKRLIHTKKWEKNISMIMNEL